MSKRYVPPVRDSPGDAPRSTDSAPSSGAYKGSWSSRPADSGDYRSSGDARHGGGDSGSHDGGYGSRGGYGGSNYGGSSYGGSNYGGYGGDARQSGSYRSDAPSLSESRSYGSSVQSAPQVTGPPQITGLGQKQSLFDTNATVFASALKDSKKAAKEEEKRKELEKKAKEQEEKDRIRAEFEALRLKGTETKAATIVDPSNIVTPPSADSFAFAEECVKTGLLGRQLEAHIKEATKSRKLDGSDLMKAILNVQEAKRDPPTLDWAKLDNYGRALKLLLNPDRKFQVNDKIETSKYRLWADEEFKKKQADMKAKNQPALSAPELPSEWVPCHVLAVNDDKLTVCVATHPKVEYKNWPLDKVKAVVPSEGVSAAAYLDNDLVLKEDGGKGVLCKKVKTSGDNCHLRAMVELSGVTVEQCQYPEDFPFTARPYYHSQQLRSLNHVFEYLLSVKFPKTGEKNKFPIFLSNSLFITLFKLEIIEPEAFTEWNEDDKGEKQAAFITLSSQTTEFFGFLRNIDRDEEDEEEADPDVYLQNEYLSKATKRI